MAAITPVAAPKAFYILRDATTQADTGQTDWIAVPKWAVYCTIYLNVTATAGTTPELTPSIWAADPVRKDDSYIVQIHGNFTSVPITGAAQAIIWVGPGVAPADDLALAATGDSTGAVNVPLPDIMGIKLLLDRAGANETYTYSLAVSFRG